MWFLVCTPVVCMNVQFIFTSSLLFFNEKMSPEKLEFFAQFTATMIYNEKDSFNLEHIYLNTETYLHSVCSIRSRCHVREKQETDIYIYSGKNSACCRTITGEPREQFLK